MLQAQPLTHQGIVSLFARPKREPCECRCHLTQLGSYLKPLPQRKVEHITVFECPACELIIEATVKGILVTYHWRRDT